MLEVGCGYLVVPFSNSFFTAIALLVLVGEQIPMETISGKSRVIITQFGIANPEELLMFKQLYKYPPSQDGQQK